MSKKTKSKSVFRNTVWVLMGCLLAAGVLTAVWLYRSGFNTTETTYLYIDTDDDVDSVGQKIAEVAKPQNMRVFHLYAGLLNLKEHIRTGRYEVTPDQTMLNLIRNIRNHNEKPIMMVVPSVRTMEEMAGRLGNQLMIDSASITDYLKDEGKIAALGYTKESLPGLFVPNTYEVYWDMSIDRLFERLQKENAAFWNESRLAKLQEVSEYAGEEMTKEKVITLAAIVDSETANNGEKPNIAALYMNRMRKGMPLQSDPTVIYALKDFSIRRVLHEHLKVDSPYNTYRNTGLPPGPIRVPSIAGIDAVLNHANNNYIYMCAKEDFSGTHNFAVNYAEHLLNAAKYVKALNERGIR
ncbi:MAG: endolytic transglycosylase MltG [Bacteroidaceae bacterium]|nr:endolytic transglycosylase MltG [Bacteroidaceae bacterium]